MGAKYRSLSALRMADRSGRSPAEALGRHRCPVHRVAIGWAGRRLGYSLGSFHCAKRLTL
jgi:hypothetical protein